MTLILVRELNDIGVEVTALKEDIKCLLICDVPNTTTAKPKHTLRLNASWW
jgi:hypothetical protein